MPPTTDLERELEVEPTPAEIGRFADDGGSVDDGDPGDTTTEILAGADNDDLAEQASADVEDDDEDDLDDDDDDDDEDDD